MPHVQYDVVVEKRVPLPNWTGRVLGADVAVTGDDEVMVSAIELKWADEHLDDVLWDFLKLASAVRSGDVESAFLAVAAPNGCWAKRRCANLFDDRVWSIKSLLLSETAGQWTWLMKNNTPRPTRLPAEIRTEEVMSVPIHLATEDDWLLRAVAVTPLEGPEIRPDANGVPLVEEGEPPTVEDIEEAERREVEARRHRARSAGAP